MNKQVIAAVVGLTLILVGFNWSRFSCDVGEPASFLEAPGVWVQLGSGFPESGIARHYIDDVRLSGVIALTSCRVPASVWDPYPQSFLLESGRRIDIVVQDAEIQAISLTWMSAGQRVALGIPLHPDRMTRKDWEFLPGVGAKMAARIEENRQNNGDFGSLKGLLRIKGVGMHKIAAWREFFK